MLNEKLDPGQPRIELHGTDRAGASVESLVNVSWLPGGETTALLQGRTV